MFNKSITKKGQHLDIVRSGDHDVLGFQVAVDDVCRVDELRGKEMGGKRAM
jgi:hypothetical protein